MNRSTGLQPNRSVGLKPFEFLRLPGPLPKGNGNRGEGLEGLVRKGNQGSGIKHAVGGQKREPHPPLLSRDGRLVAAFGDEADAFEG